MGLPRRVTAGVWGVVLALLAAGLPARAGGPQPGSVILASLPPDYGWWNGCAPTSAAMLFAWWGQQGYGVFPTNYPAPPATYPLTSAKAADYTDARGAIAGWAHKQQGMSRGLTYGSYKSHPPDSLADFLLTYNGNTSASSVAHGLVSSGAWDDPRTPQIESRQFVASMSYTAGDSWTYQRYVAEIDAGRPVYLGWSSPTLGHATLGVGYNNTDGKQDVIALTTWRQGPQQWQWDKETSSGYGLSVDCGALLKPTGAATPRLSAYFSIARDYIGDLGVELGIGNPQNPQWKTAVRSPDNSYDHNLVVTDIDCTEQLSRFRASPLSWYLKVTSEYAQYPGTVQDFQVRYGLDQHVFKYAGSPVPTDAGQAVYVYLDTSPFAISSTWQGGSASAGSWGDDANWDQGVPQYLGDTAALGNSSVGHAGVVVTLDGDRTLSGLNLTDTEGGGYTIAQGLGGKLTLANGSRAATVTLGAGRHTIAAPLALESDLSIAAAADSSLTISGAMSGPGKSFTKAGAGVVVLAGPNRYTGGTVVSEGLLEVACADGLPSGNALTIGSSARVVLASGRTAGDRGGAPAAVPEPSAVVLLGVLVLPGLFTVVARWMRRRLSFARAADSR